MLLSLLEYLPILMQIHGYIASFFVRSLDTVVMLFVSCRYKHLFVTESSECTFFVTM